MRIRICFLTALLILLCAVSGCRSGQPAVEDTSVSYTPDPSAVSESTVTVEALPTSESFVTVETPPTGEESVTVVVTPPPTPEPTPTAEPTPAPTLTPEPTPTPEPVPYAGVWTIEDLPFSLELRNTRTYTVTTTDGERSGVFSTDASDVVLEVEGREPVRLTYYSRSDVMKVNDFRLIRDDLVLYNDLDYVPTSFYAENDDLIVSVRGAIVEARRKNGGQMLQYNFTKKGLTPAEDSRDWFDVSDSGEPADTLCIFKYDGEYTLRVRDESGNALAPIDVTVVSGFRYPIRAEGLEPLGMSLRSILKNDNVSIDDMNRAISRDVVAAGLYTRAGVVTSGVSLISHMAEYGYSVVSQERGTYQGMEDWGVNPRWGEKLDRPDADESAAAVYVGMQSTASIIWAYKQAGMNLVAHVGGKIGTLGEHARAKDNRIDNDRAESGDIVQSSKGHCLMIVDRLDLDSDGADDAYLTYEMWNPHLTLLELPFDSIKSRVFYSMDAFFDNTGRNANKAEFWSDTFRIPYESLPAYIRETQESDAIGRRFETLLLQLGFER